ncbi:MAG: Rrf2 family transcriptional regulator [Planctomycetaceae bacterium]|nr:Rrf2 family transcriptional regulator [Planctomycetaceae bacterium]
MITQTAEYALRAVVFLADQDGAPQTSTQIAEATLVPAGYLSKVMQKLSRNKIVNSRRGLNGGFTLVKDASELTALEVINNVDRVQRFHECPLGIESHGTRLCPLHRRLDDAGKAAEETFGDTTIEELISVPRARKPLCRFPLAKK